MLTNKVALVTGGSRGIGKEICINLAKNHCNVALVFQGNKEKADEVCATLKSMGVNSIAYKCDVANFNDVKELIQLVIKDFSTIDILVNCAGIIKDNLTLAMTEDDFDSVINVNLKGTFNTIKHIYPIFARKRKGRIINISSISGLMGNAGQANYSASKAGVVGLSKTIAKELASRSITCNVVAPGFIETAMTSSLNQVTLEKAINEVPMKRMGKAEEVAALVSFLASDSASYITGEVIKVDGGMYI